MIEIIYFGNDEIGQEVDCYEIETTTTYWRTVESYVNVYSDLYELQTLRIPGYDYKHWCSEGIEHTKEERENDVIYTRKMLITGNYLSFKTNEEFFKFLEKHSPVKITTSQYALLNGTSVIGVEEYDNDY